MCRWCAILALWVALGSAAGLLAAVTAPALFGLKSFTVLSGSMEPTLKTGDVVVDETIAPGQMKVGDVVTFREPDSTRLVTHRVREISATGAIYHVTTKGDANHTTEKWNIEAAGKVGRTRYHVPKMGYVMAWIHGPLGRVGLLIVPALLLGAFELARIWRRPQREVSSGVEA